MEILERVFNCFMFAEQQRYQAGLDAICPALEATARKHLKVSKITQGRFKEFIRQYYWLLERFAGEGLNFEETVFPKVRVKTDDDRVLDEPDLADIIYHVFRCSLAHGHSIGSEYAFVVVDEPGIHRWEIQLNGEQIRMPVSMYWALVALVVFCEANEDIVSNSRCCLTWGGAGTRLGDELYRFDIDVFWGAEKLVRKFFDSRPSIRVALDFRDKQ